MQNDNDNYEETMENNGDDGSKPSSEYVKQLLQEKVGLSQFEDTYPHAMRLLDDEVVKAQSLIGGKGPKPDSRYIDMGREKPIKVSARVLVPVKEHPKFNFVGKLLGPKGHSLKRLQEETMTRMAILGRGSMRDKAKEEEYRNSLEPKYAHLCDDLHVEIQTIAPPAEAYARIAYALAEVKKYLIPDVNDDVRQEQIREFQQFTGPAPGGPAVSGSLAPPVRGAPGGRGRGVGRGGPGRPPMIGAGRGMPPGMGMPPRPQGKSKVLSILDKARAAMDESFGGPEFEGGYYDPPAPMPYGSSYNGSGFYDESGYGGRGGEGMGAGGWKSYGPKREGFGGGKALPGVGNRFGNTRPTPYARAPK